ncbi:MAG TPA: DNA recombination/repair protein RecA, partial [Clostridiales bacterium]|nr:DNA recombination/repair protein RecA [Clostridiales bacterium]
GVLQKSGSWISYQDEKIGQGREKVISLLKANPDLCKEIEDKVKELLDSGN